MKIEGLKVCRGMEVSESKRISKEGENKGIKVARVVIHPFFK
jgi:hypothetical protein